MIRLQLRVYYGLRGLTGKALKHAIKRDMVAIGREALMSSWASDESGILAAMNWKNSQDGHGYWAERHWPLDSYYRNKFK